MRKTLIPLVLFLGQATFTAQDRLDRAIQILEKNYSQEKAYIITDKDQYVSGDTIWFKTFVFDGYKASIISSTLFVELYDNDKKLISSKTLQLVNGAASGNFKLKDDTKENVYFIRVYTPWMANFKEEFQLMKPIAIYNPSSPQKLEIDANQKWTASAKPEGGTFVTGIATKFAVRLNSPGTFPSDWSGYVVDADNPNEKIVTFKALDQNVASFTLTPKANKKYQVLVEDKQGNKQNIDLSPSSETGVVLQTESNKDGIKYTLKGSNLTNGLQNYKVVGTINNQLAYRANVKQASNEISSIIPANVNEGNNGILQLVVFDDKDQIVAQRLSFIKPNELNINKPTLSNVALNTTSRAQNSFEITPTPGFYNYTVLVKDASTATKKDNENLLSALWLTGDLSSKIYAPAQYFSKNANATALDALLMSEKWDRFDWKEVMSGNIPNIKYKPQNYLSYKGKVTINSRPLPYAMVNLLYTYDDGGTNMTYDQTDSEGNIYIENLYFEKAMSISYFLSSGNNKESSAPENLSLIFQPIVTPVLYNNNLPATNYHLVTRTADSKIAPEITRAITSQKNEKVVVTDDSVQIAAVNIKAKKQDPKEKLNEELSTPMFQSVNSTIFDFVNEDQAASGYMDVLQWLQGRAAGLTFQRDQSGNNIPYIRGSQAKLYLDEMQVDANAITSISIGQIAMVKILKGAGLIGDAVLIYTRKGDMSSKNDSKNLSKNNKITLVGYSVDSDYNKSEYTKASPQSVTNDTRDVLYWNPSLSGENNQAPQVDFYNNDGSKTYQTTIISFDRKSNISYYNETLSK